MSDVRHIGVKAVLTSGQCAKACGVAPGTMAKWIDAKLLPSFRLPESKCRRVYAEDLVKFMRERGLRVPDELGGGEMAVAVNVEGVLAGAVPMSEFELGLACSRGTVLRVVVGCTRGYDAALALAASIHASFRAVRVAVVLSSERAYGDTEFDAAFAHDDNDGVLQWVSGKHSSLRYATIRPRRRLSLSTRTGSKNGAKSSEQSASG